VACISGEEEIEGTSEEVSGMKKKKDKLEALLMHNIDEQLANIDWDNLNAAISARLDETQQTRTSASGLPAWFRISALTTAAAAVFIIVMISYTNNKGSATVAFINPSDRTHVQVKIDERDSKRGKCDVRIIDLSTTQKKEEKTRPNWFVISKTESASTNNGLDRDIRDIACLF
jgi:anti-sigma-K factor RskA